MQTSIDPLWEGWKSPLCRKTIDETYDISVPLGTATAVDVTAFAEIDETTASGMSGTTDRLVAPKTGWYILDMNCRIEIHSD